ncbi:MAG: beta-L-arabinofuranosidase domain-containing protein, partial [Prevotella sp.]
GYFTMKKLGGWESLDCDLRGHITGHLLSALAMLYAQTGSTAVKMKSDSIVNALNEVQQQYGNGYLSAFGEGLIDRNMKGKSVWAPFYTLHKIAQGLLDQYSLCHNDTALKEVTRMAHWAYTKLQGVDDEQRRRMLRNEFGGFPEAMYNLYGFTRDEKALWVARFFYDNAKIDPLKQGNADLGTNHANTFIPKLIGECRNYELFGDTLSRKAAELLFRTLAFRHAFVTGEVSDKEHLFDPDQQSKHLTGYDGENCCTYNLLKLADHIFEWTASREVADYYERALYNHILGQQDPQTSMVTYFTPLQTGAYRLYSTRDSSYWCCVGSGFESHVKYASSIWFHTSKDLYLNLFIPSRLDWEGTKVNLSTRFPADGEVILKISGKSRRFTLKLRCPRWTTSMQVWVNGRRQKTDIKDGYASISRNWKQGDRVSIRYGMSLREEATTDDPARTALLYGPVVLAGELDTVSHPFSSPKKYNDYYTYDYQVPASLVEHCQYHSINDFESVGNLQWRSKNGILVKPFFDVHHHRYVVYWNKKEK